MTGSHPPRFGLKVGGQDVTAAELRAVWRIADDAGFDHCWVLDLFAAIGPQGPDRPIFEGWALQAAMAVSTSRVRIGCTFTGNSHRPPWLLAKLAVTVDHLSDGRLEFGIGAGYEEVESRMYDISLDHRVGRLAESLECLKLLWTRERVDYDGRYYTLRDAIANPKPIQRPQPPIWLAAGGDRMLRVAAHHADVWHGPGIPAVVGTDQAPGIARFRELSDQLDAAAAEIGRDPTGIRRAVQIAWDGRDPAELVAASRDWLAAGCTEQIVYLHPLQLDPPGVIRAAEAAAAALPNLRAAAAG